MRRFIDERFSSVVLGVPMSFVKSNGVAFRHTWVVANYCRVLQEYVSELREDVSFVPGLFLSDIVDDGTRDVPEFVYKKVRLAHMADISFAIDSFFAFDIASLLAFRKVGEAARFSHFFSLQDTMFASW